MVARRCDFVLLNDAVCRGFRGPIQWPLVIVAEDAPIKSRWPSILTRVFSRARALQILLAALLAVFSAPVQAQQECSAYHPEARRPRPSDPYYYVVESHGADVCAIADRDRRTASDLNMNYYAQSEANCRSMPGMIEWSRDRGAGYNLCLFRPPATGQVAPPPSSAPPPTSYLPLTGPNSCDYANDGVCDEPRAGFPGICSAGTDTNDCQSQAAAPPLQSSPQRPFSLVEVMFCNETNLVTSVAIRYWQSEGLWIISGWYPINPGGCQVVGSFRHDASLFYHAFNDRGIWSNSGRAVCIDVRSAYRRESYDGSGTYQCRQNEELRYFNEINFEDGIMQFTQRLVP